MPLRVSVGLTKKIGQPHYGSLGASCHVDYEAESGLLQHDVAKFHDQVKSAFVACRQAVQHELYGTTSEQSPPEQPPNGEDASSSDEASAEAPSNGQPSGPPPAANGHDQASRNGRKATDSQVRAIRRIADRLQLNLADWLQRHFGLRVAEELSVGDASQTIDAFKALLAHPGHGGQR